MAIFYVDENVSFSLNDALRTYGHEVFTTRDERRLGATDSSQLLYAAGRGWIVLIHNRADFALLHDAWHLWAHAWQVEPEQLHPPRHAELATLIHTLCQQHRMVNTLFRLEARNRMGTKSAFVNARLSRCCTRNGRDGILPHRRECGAPKHVPT